MTLIAALLLLAGSVSGAAAELTVDSYCQLVVASMQQEITFVQEIINLSNQYGDDPTTLEIYLENKRAEHAAANEVLFFSYYTDADVYIAFMGQHRQAVDQYLAENADIKQQIEDLSVQLTALMAEEESLLSTDEPEVPPEP
jgi:hypothetical protein